MHSKSKKNNLRRETFLLMGILLAGLLVVPFAQLGQAQETEGLVRLHASEEFADLMKENPEAAKERFDEGIHLTYKGERPVRVRLYSAIIAEGEIQRQHLSETAATFEPGTTRSLAESGEEFVPGPQWVPGPRWIPNPETYSKGFLFGEGSYEEGGPFIPEDLREGLFSASQRTNKASPLLYLVAVPSEEFSQEVGTLPLVVGGPDVRFPGSQWVPGDSWIPSSNW